MKNILITGGCGFIGSHLCRQLLLEGNRIYCLDNLSSGSLKNIEELMPHPYFTFIHQDVCTPVTLEVDEIYNLACPASPAYYQKDPVQTTKSSVLGIINMLELARANDCKLLQASTSEVYGDPDVHPQPEGYWGKVNPNGIRSCYDEGKRCAESLCMDFHRMYGVQVKIVRIFNTYGPYMAANDGRVLSNFIVQALHGEALTVYGDGRQTRCFMYIDDLLKGFRSMMDTGRECTGPVNLGNPTEYTILETAYKVLSLTRSQSPVTFMKSPQDDPRRRKPDIQCARELLGWSPAVTLNEGLEKMIAFYQRQLN